MGMRVLKYRWKETTCRRQLIEVAAAPKQYNTKQHVGIKRSCWEGMLENNQRLLLTFEILWKGVLRLRKHYILAVCRHHQSVIERHRAIPWPQTTRLFQYNKYPHQWCPPTISTSRQLCPRNNHIQSFCPTFPTISSISLKNSTLRQNDILKEVEASSKRAKPKM